jgi:hypothetical protein
LRLGARKAVYRFIEKPPGIGEKCSLRQQQSRRRKG